MPLNDFRPTLRRFLEDNFLFGDTLVGLGDQDSFIDHQILDSTGFLELVSFIEETWGIAVADEEMIPEHLDSLDALNRFLRLRVCGATGSAA